MAQIPKCKHCKQEILDKMSYYYKNFGLLRLAKTTYCIPPFYLFDRDRGNTLLTHRTDLIRLKFNYRKINYEKFKYS